MICFCQIGAPGVGIRIVADAPLWKGLPCLPAGRRPFQYHPPETVGTSRFPNPSPFESDFENIKIKIQADACIFILMLSLLNYIRTFFKENPEAEF